MRFPFKAAAVVPMAAVAAAGVVAFSAGPASAVSHGSRAEQQLIGGCAVDLTINKSTSLAYAYVGPFSSNWTCQGYVRNNAGSTSWTPNGNGGWSKGVRHSKGYKAWACVYPYYKGKAQKSGCTGSH
jgi:hypothetical protein